MNIYSLVWQELWHRKSQLISGLLAITLGIGVIVGIRSVAVVSEKAVAVNLDNLGANILVLPQGASVDDYYTADIDAPTFPEDYVERIVTSTLPGLDNLSPKMTRRVKIGEYSIVLTGILPASEIASKPIWQTAGLIGNDLQATCALTNPVNQSSGFEDERLQRKSIDSLGLHDCLVGSAAAMRLGLSEGSKIKIKNSEFLVAKVLPETGIVDDDRIFAHLHTVQDLLGISHQISAIEIMGCCNAISDGLLSKLRNILPDTRITTIGQIVSTQIETNRLMNKVSLIFLVIILFVGGISIGNFMWANVNERKKEIGILLMIGTPKSSIYTMLLVKATILGLVGGVLGYAIGTIAGMILGPQLAGIIVRPVPVFLVWSILLSIVIAILGSLLPAYLAAKIEPFTIMQEM
ncbi:MAG: ABC transporter permease [Deltaproteobacteria bacterium]|jgi:putative ABC transport system permease protein|nr:ABC transporter permease [Deltaproteobacteria bacterium]